MRNSPRSLLLHLILILLLAYLPAFWFASCEKIDSKGVNASVQEQEESVTVKKDSCTIILTSKEDFRDADIFIYENGGIGKLETHINCVNGDSEAVHPDSLGILLFPGSKTVVAVANSAKSFNTDALSLYDSAEQLRYEIRDENARFALLTCTEEFNSSDRVAVMKLEPLRCRIVLENIEHSLPGYKRLEDPYLMVDNSSASAVIFKEDGHRVTDVVSDTAGLRGIIWERLPYDIGMYAQQPGTTVFCYPCDDAASAVKPSVVIGCTIDGVSREYRQEMPLLKRGSTLYVSLCVGTRPEDFKFSFRSIGIN